MSAWRRGALYRCGNRWRAAIATRYCVCRCARGDDQRRRTDSGRHPFVAAVEKDPSRKAFFEEKSMHYLDRAEQLEKVLDGEAGGFACTTATAQLASTLVNC